MSSKSDLKIDWCSVDAAKYACLNWHYSKSMPVAKCVHIGVWEAGRFIGVVLFSWGSNYQLGSPFGLEMTECCELVRVALRDHVSPVSRILRVSLLLLKKQSPGIKAVISYADPTEGHHGGIYQAGNWIYTGRSAPTFEYRLNGKRLNKRAYTGNNFGAGKKVLPSGAKKVHVQGKHRYVMPLSDDVAHVVASMKRPYPKRASDV